MVWGERRTGIPVRRTRRVGRVSMIVEGSLAGHHGGVSLFDQDRLRSLLQASEATLSAPLADDEIVAVQSRFGFEFSQDQRELYAIALPTGPEWPDWRRGPLDELRRWLDWPVDGVLFDVEHKGFWPSSWGERPHSLNSAIDVARGHMRAVPVLIPVYSHRYLPGAPVQPHVPVFSVYQTDTIYYGHDLVDYLENEFVRPPPGPPIAGPVVHVAFWSELAEGREDEL